MTKYQTSKNLVVSLLLAAAAPLAHAADKCNALVLSGGGSNGAWEVGVIWGLVHSGNPSDF
jgi:predicted acylesterase/phospholipase RssA